MVAVDVGDVVTVVVGDVVTVVVAVVITHSRKVPSCMSSIASFSRAVALQSAVRSLMSPDGEHPNTVPDTSSIDTRDTTVARNAAAAAQAVDPPATSSNACPATSVHCTSIDTDVHVHTTC